MNTKENLSLLEQLEQWSNEQKHQKVVEHITALPEKDRTYEIIGQFARALNNLERYEEAIKQLKAVKKQGENDSLWHFRLGYAYYYLDQEEKALPEFEKACILNPEDEDAWLFLYWCCDILGIESNIDIPADILERLEKEQAGDNDNLPETYTQEEIEEIESFIETHFGHFSNVFHELVSPDIHVDIAIIEPTADHNYYTLVTMGMGAHQMDLPEDLKGEVAARAELLVCLPVSWDITNNDEKWYWPLRWLKILARLPGEEETWLGFGHTIPNGEPFAENTELTSVVLTQPVSFLDQEKPIEEIVCTLPNGEQVAFYQMIPIYDEELTFKMENNTESLLARMVEKDALDQALTVNVHRQNVCV